MGHTLPVFGKIWRFIHSNDHIIFFFCVVGIYLCFLTWGILQERITTIDYQVQPHYYHSHSESVNHGNYLLYITISFYNWYRHSLYNLASSLLNIFGVTLSHFDLTSKDHIPFTSLFHSKFESFIFLNFSQCIGSIIISCFMIFFKTGRLPFFFHNHSNDDHHEKIIHEKYPSLDRHLLFYYFRIALCFCCASPFGYSSLKYIGYVAMNLGKSCKLLPLILMSVIIRRQRIDTIKLISLILITVGVSCFMLFDDKKPSKIAENAFDQGIPLLISDIHFIPTWMKSWIDYFVSESFYGTCLLLTNLMLDGAMNTWQDEMFSMYKLSSYHMMFHMNWISVFIMLLYFLSNITNEWSNSMQFILRYPNFLADLVLFALCGAAGQAIVFFTIEKFGAVSLVTVTVTRKLFTILLSVVYFGHQLNYRQWLSVATVFIALGLESALSKHKKRIIPKDQLSIPESPSDPTLYKIKPIGISSSDFEVLEQKSDTEISSNDSNLSDYSNTPSIRLTSSRNLSPTTSHVDSPLRQKVI